MLETFRKSNYEGLGRIYPLGIGPETNSGKYVGLYYAPNCAGERVTLIGVADANADMRADGDTDAVEGDVGFYYPAVRTTGAISYLTAATWRMATKAGYWFGMCQRYGSTFYNKTQAANHYAIVAFPADYGSSGQTTFIVNENGTVYSMDFGVGEWRNSPGADPVSAGWEIAE